MSSSSMCLLKLKFGPGSSANLNYENGYWPKASGTTAKCTFRQWYFNSGINSAKKKGSRLRIIKLQHGRNRKMVRRNFTIGCVALGGSVCTNPTRAILLKSWICLIIYVAHLEILATG